MKKTVLPGSTAAIAASVALAFALMAGAPQVANAETASGTVNRAEVEGIIRDYLLKNPEIMLEVQEALEAKQQEE